MTHKACLLAFAVCLTAMELAAVAHQTLWAEEDGLCYLQQPQEAAAGPDAQPQNQEEHHHVARQLARGRRHKRGRTHHGCRRQVTVAGSQQQGECSNERWPCAADRRKVECRNEEQAQQGGGQNKPFVPAVGVGSTTVMARLAHF